MSKNCRRRLKADRHHILFQRRYWEKGYAKALRDAFVREVPVFIHRELHSRILRDVPVPSGNLCRVAWEEYCRNRNEIDSYDVARACAWLYTHIPDAGFRRAMQAQIDFFATRIVGGQ